MAQVTSKGLKLAQKLAPSIGIPDGIFETCSLICRHAVTYHHLQEASCNGHPAMGDPVISVERANRLQEKYDEWIAKREGQIERRINELVASLPLVNGEPIRADFSGDPRGATVKLVMPDGRYDDWGQRGLCVPTN